MWFNYSILSFWMALLCLGLGVLILAIIWVLFYVAYVTRMIFMNYMKNIDKLGNESDNKKTTGKPNGLYYMLFVYII